MKRDLDNLKHLIKEYGFEAFEDVLLQHARPSIRVETQPVDDESKLAIGQSKIGGRPDLPTNMDWVIVTSNDKRASLQFLAQFDLADIKPYDVENLLPDKGILYFFGDPWRADKHTEKGRVIFYTGDISQLERKPFPDDLYTTNAASGEQHRYKPCLVTFIPEWNLNDVRLLITEYPPNKTWIDRSNLIAAANYKQQSPPFPDVNRILGVNADVPADVQTECQHIEDTGSPYYDTEEKWEAAAKKKDDWQLLFQLSSDDNAAMMWSDKGIVCFYIKKHDLKIPNFNNLK